MRVFVTGATGFAGSHLVDLLLSQGHELFALGQPGLGRGHLAADVVLVEADLQDREGVITAVTQTKPDIIYHLAGQAYPARSWQTAALTIAINTGGTANVLDAAVKHGNCRVVVVTSAEIYGLIQKQDLPLTEETPPEPRHPYGVSKWAAAQLVALYWQRYQLPVVEARPFNHIGPRQALGFVAPDFASQLAAIQLGKAAPVLSVGNLDAERDFTDVRDVVRAYVALAERGEPGQGYLICSAQPVTVYYLLNVLLELSGLRVEVVYDPARMRPSDVPCLYGSYAKIEAQTGWRPQIHLRQSLADVLQEWRSK